LLLSEREAGVGMLNGSEGSRPGSALFLGISDPEFLESSVAAVGVAEFEFEERTEFPKGSEVGRRESERFFGGVEAVADPRNGFASRSGAASDGGASGMVELLSAEAYPSFDVPPLRWPWTTAIETNAKTIPNKPTRMKGTRMALPPSEGFFCGKDVL
jgi:hypothetical protein